MSMIHQDLAAGRWASLSFMEQMSNIGSEVERALNWKERGNKPYSDRAFERALELVDLTLGVVKGLARLKELARTRESLVDFFIGNNDFSSTSGSFKSYFLPFVFAARRHH
jgi:hypothetical protein